MPTYLFVKIGKKNPLSPYIQAYPFTVFPHIRPAGIIFLCSLQIRVLLEITKFLLHKVIRIAGIIKVAGIIRGRVLYEEILWGFLSFSSQKTHLTIILYLLTFFGNQNLVMYSAVEDSTAGWTQKWNVKLTR